VIVRARNTHVFFCELCKTRIAEEFLCVRVSHSEVWLWVGVWWVSAKPQLRRDSVHTAHKPLVRLLADGRPCDITMSHTITRLLSTIHSSNCLMVTCMCV
jgi:hypothetical protein